MGVCNLSTYVMYAITLLNVPYNTNNLDLLDTTLY